jgi:protoporphyrin/coproporphyrin ferrochelatase
MSKYLGEPDLNPDEGPGRLGVLLVNLGTPDAPTPAAVRRFLAQFLWDPRVIEAPRWLWWLALHGVILRIRPAKSAHAYQQIWTPDGSPLLLHSRALTEKVRDTLKPKLDASVALGMSYGSPSIPSALAQLRSEGVRRLIVLPLYPQYSATTTASVFDRVTTELQRWRRLPEFRFINSYHAEPAYIEALSADIQRHWHSRGKTHLLFSFHGVPRRYVAGGDPYERECLATARQVAAHLGLSESDWSVSFQSQVGREEWLKPYTDQLLLQYAQQGPKRVSVICPGFATDCLETLEEIALRNRAAFLAAGGELYDYIPALNASEAHAALLCDLLVRHARGWPQADASEPVGGAAPRPVRDGTVR